jgi:pimeloyl-ACP methyl ester carboxylesterase/membrane protein DedA with SNARE-associated domain
MGGGYLFLLVISFWFRTSKQPPALDNDFRAVELRAVAGEQLLETPVRVIYREYGSSAPQSPRAVILLHGSPGHHRDFSLLAGFLADECRLVAPDLPGFGRSTHNIPHYSIRTHGRYVLQMMDRLGLDRVHLVGFSMGGGVALNVAGLVPSRVVSLTLLSSIGVQEMELFGDYHLNHFLHGIQLAGIWLLREAVPHMGTLDDAMMGVPYARNFYDSDQRPLREILGRIETPVLIIHGRHDILVPVQAALEHHRLVPQSELVLLEAGHFAAFSEAANVARHLGDFIARADGGQGTTRAHASPERKTRASLPFDRKQIPPAMGVAAALLFLGLASATLVSEDLTCIAAGVMVAEGKAGFSLAAGACLFGIFVGDLLLFLAGRALGRPALKRAPFKWFLQDRDVEKSSAWFSRHGMKFVLLSRFLPGTRLPAYFAAGVLQTDFWKFAFYCLLGAAVWTPVLVGVSAALGEEVTRAVLIQGQHSLTRLAIAGFAVLVTVKLLGSLSSYRGRRLWVSAWRRAIRWEFWPPWMFYIPVAGYVAFLALKHRSLTLFTAVNPAMPAGGFIGESKSEILDALSGAGELVARFGVIEPATDKSIRLSAARAFMQQNRLSFPVVLKPDVGQRGSGVAVVRSEPEMEEFLASSSSRAIIQEYAPGFEFGVFYYRHPGDDRGHIFSITEKQFPMVRGDGESTLERLILRNDRAVCMARFYLAKQAERLWDVPKAGESVRLVELGTHCRGAVFLDGSWIKTEALEQVIDEISQSYRGFYFGRFDIRTPSVEDFRQGRNFKIVELNGVTSEATHIYDPQNSLFDAYRVLFKQWRLAFEIGEQNRRRRFDPTPLWALAGLLLEFKRRPRLQMG